jgi:cytochrome c oxidase subunit I+III
MSSSLKTNPENTGRGESSNKPFGHSEFDPGNTEELLKQPVQDEALRRQWKDPEPTFLGRLKALQNDTIGQRLIFTAFGFFILGGINALLMRIQLAQAENTFLSPDTYNQFFTMHGSTMMYLFAVPILEGFAIMLLPFILGNREMPFPRLGVFSYWVFLFGGLLFYASFLFNAVPENGWFAYVPLAGPVYSPDISMDFWLLALGVAEVSAIAAGIEIIISILNMRAPGMTLSRIPLFAWAMLVTAFMILFAFTPLFVASMLMEMDRHFHTQFFNTAAGGTPVLWQHLFWIFGHPEVYIQFIPATGFVSMIVPVFARRPIVGYPLIVLAIIAMGFISFGLWAHHMFTVGLPAVSMTFFTAASTMIAIPAGVQIFAWITTILRGRPRWNTPLLFVIGFIMIFVLGGITGVMVASVPFDSQVHDSYFVVAHFHYVLIGGVTFPLFAAFYYWIPKWSGKLLFEGLGKLHFWLLFIGFNVTFFPMHIVGILGMPRRVYTYPAGIGWDIYNFISTMGAFMIAVSVLVFLANLFLSYRSGHPAGDNPWDADSLEWNSTSPPIPHNFSVMPIVHSRHPLWEQESLHEGDERAERLVKALGRWPTTWRAAISTSTVDGRPQEVFRVAEPSIWPFIAAVGLITVFGSEIWSLRWLAGVGALIFIVSVIGWHWPSPAPTSREEEQAFAREHGIPVRTSGSRLVARNGMILTLLVFGIGLANLLFAYFYIRLENRVWPPQGFENPDFILPVIAVLLWLVSLIPAVSALRSVHHDNKSGLRNGLLLAFLPAAVAAGLMVYILARKDYTVADHAYASIFIIIEGFLVLLMLGGLGMNLFVQFFARRGKYSPEDNIGVANTTLFFQVSSAFAVVIVAVLYGIPYLT